MGETIRFGVSLDSELLERFDALIAEKCYQTRSEAIRDLLRNALVQREWEEVSGELVGTLTLVYDHHHSDLSKKLTDIQHDGLDWIVTTLHIHLDHHNCMEVLVLKGPGGSIKELAQRLISIKGVKHGKLSLATTGRELT